MQMPLPGAVCPATVQYLFFNCRVPSRAMTPETSKTDRARARVLDRRTQTARPRGVQVGDMQDLSAAAAAREPPPPFRTAERHTPRAQNSIRPVVVTPAAFDFVDPPIVRL